MKWKSQIRGCRSPSRDLFVRKALICISVLAAVLFITVMVLAAALAGGTCKAPVVEQGVGGVAACPSDGWLAFQGKCYNFSEAEGNWTYSRNHCSSLGASLAAIDTQQEQDFLLRYRGHRDHWIGLRNEMGPHWRWANGTKFNNWFRIGGGGECVYLKEAIIISSSQCSMERHWICSKPQI